MEKIKNEYYVIAGLLACFLGLTFLVVTGRTDIFDKSVFEAVIKLRCSFVTMFLRFITHLASTLGTLILLSITGFIFTKKKRFFDFRYMISNVGIGVIIMQIIKSIIRRPRPAWKWIVQGGFSYPSGHTISAILFYGTLILLVNKKVKKKVKKFLTVFLSLMIVLTGISRIYFGAHYLTDVVGSLILGTIILLISNMFMNGEFKNDKNKDKKAV